MYQKKRALMAARGHHISIPISQSFPLLSASMQVASWEASEDQAQGRRVSRLQCSIHDRHDCRTCYQTATSLAHD